MGRLVLYFGNVALAASSPASSEEIIAQTPRMFLLRMDRGVPVQTLAVCHLGHIRENRCLARTRGKLLPLAGR